MRLGPPPRDAPAVETFRWVRRIEIAGGFVGILMAVALWGGALGWILLVVAALSFQPWHGAAVLVRRAERDPQRYAPPSPDVRKERERRARRITAAWGMGFSAISVPVNYLIYGDWVVAGIAGALLALVIAVTVGLVGRRRD